MFRTILLLAAAIAVCTLSVDHAALGKDDDSMSIGQRFHYETSFGKEGYRGKNIGWGREIPVYKTYENATAVRLPVTDFKGDNIEAVIGRRRSVRDFADTQLTLEQLSQLLVSADGVTGRLGSFELRAAPSGGALYPIDIYVVAKAVDSLAAGLYHFHVRDTSLELIREGDFSHDIHVAANEQDAVGSSPVTFVLTSRWDRSTRKYGDRGYRYAYMEAGAICENIYLEAASLGLGTVAVGSFNDQLLNDFLGVDGLDESALLVMPVGAPR